MTTSKNRRKKGRSSFGFTRKLPSDNWQASYVDKAGVRRTAPRTYSDTEADRAEMNLWLAGKALAYRSGEGTQQDADRVHARRKGRGVTLGDYAEEWLETRIVKDRYLKARTKAEYRRLLESPNGLQSIADHKVQGITKSVVRDWFDEVSNTVNERTGRKNSTQAARAYQFLKALMASAVADDLVSQNPCVIRGASNLKTGIKKGVPKLKPEELKIILETVNPWYRTLVIFAAVGGLRFGEVTALTRQDIDTTGNFVVVRVNKGVVYIPREGFQVETPKNDETRTVVVPALFREVILGHLEANVGPEDEALLFPSATGTYIAESTMTKHYYQARTAAGRPDLPFHELRHFAATMYGLVPGVTEKEVMTRLGHKTKSAAWIYQHTTGRELELAEAMSELPAMQGLV